MNKGYFEILKFYNITEITNEKLTIVKIKTKLDNNGNIHEINMIGDCVNKIEFLINLCNQINYQLSKLSTELEKMVTNHTTEAILVHHIQQIFAWVITQPSRRFAPKASSINICTTTTTYST